MATYNRNKYLAEQLDSILNQTYSNFELVISDDGSTDGAEMTLKEYQKKDARIKLARNTHERGVTSNFSEAIKRCRGDIIFLADCDDVWDVSKIAEHMLAYQDVSVQCSGCITK